MKVVLGSIVVAGIALATPAAAFEKWVCTAKDSRGAKFSALADGLFDNWTRDTAKGDALAKCTAQSRAPKSCKVSDADCVRPPE